MGDVFAEGIRQTTDTEHTHAERYCGERLGHHRHPDDRGAQTLQHPDLDGGLVGGAAHGGVDAVNGVDPQGVRSLDREIPDLAVVHLLGVDERRHPVRIPPCTERRHAHQVQVITQDHDGSRLDARLEPAHGCRQDHRRRAQLMGETRQQRRDVHTVALVVVDPTAEGRDRDAGEATETEGARVARDAGRREPRELGEGERSLDLQLVADGRAQTRTEDQADRREQIGARADDPGASGREIVAGAGEPRRHVALASAALSRSITATGVGSTPRRSAT